MENWVDQANETKSWEQEESSTWDTLGLNEPVNTPPTLKDFLLKSGELEKECFGRIPTNCHKKLHQKINKSCIYFTCYYVIHAKKCWNIGF